MTTFATGPVFWILAALAVAALVVFFERFMDLRRAHVDWQDFLKGVRNVLESGNEEEAIAICEDTPVPIANVTATAIRHRHGSPFALREAVDAQGRTEVGRLERRLASLSVIGQIAPLIGLFGTIMGFIKVMSIVSANEVVPRAELVAAAVNAMVVAAEGLAIAAPVGVMYAALRIRLNKIVSDMETAASEIVGYIVSLQEAESAPAQEAKQ